MKRVVDKKGLRYQETSDRLEDVEMELARQQPYIDAIKSSDDMKQAMTLLARSERSQDESSKRNSGAAQLMLFIHILKKKPVSASGTSSTRELKNEGISKGN